MKHFGRKNCFLLLVTLLSQVRYRQRPHLPFCANNATKSASRYCLLALMNCASTTTVFVSFCVLFFATKIFFFFFSGITENYFVIVEQPLGVSLLELMKTQLANEPLIGCLKWYPEHDVSA